MPPRGQVQSNVGQRIDALRMALNKHVDATAEGVRTMMNGAALNEAVATKVVQAGATATSSVIDGVLQIVKGNIDATLDNVKAQAGITRQGRA